MARKPPKAARDPLAIQPRGTVGYADLLLSHASGGLEEMTVLADLLGYMPAQHRRDPPPRTGPSPKPPQLGPSSDEPPVFTQPAAIPDTPFWQPYQRVSQPPPTVTHGPVEPWKRPPDRPSIKDLAPWNEVAARIRTAFATPADTTAPDIDAIIRQLARGEWLDRMPRRQRRRWGDTIQIIRDRSVRLTPFYEDEDRVEKRLARLFPHHGVERAFLPRGGDRLSIIPKRGPLLDYRIPEPGTLVVVLGDLGCLAPDPPAEMSRWVRLGQQLLRADCRPVVLNPCPQSRWLPAPLRSWTIVPWDRRATGCYTNELLDARAEMLLRLASQPIRIEPGLLRDLRLLLGPQADAGTEADVWQRAELVVRSLEAAMLEREARLRLRQEALGSIDPELRAQAFERLRDWRGGELDDGVPYDDIYFEELDSLDPDTRRRLRNDDTQAAQQHWRALAAGDLEKQWSGRAWYRRLSERVPAGFLTEGGLAVQADKQALWLRAHQGVPQMPALPAGFIPGLGGDPNKPERLFDLYQTGDGVIAVPAGEGRSTGSLLLTKVRAAEDEVVVRPVDPFWASGSPPSWADTWGHDTHGAWVEFSVPGRDGARIKQRMRWIKPGHFQLGSPDDEADRYPDEGPRQPITISQGFWLFDTACSEALWDAVVDPPPPSSDRRRWGERFPITDVSWDEAQVFLQKLNALKAGLDLSLPSEARWEYACRAGMTTPYSFGTTISRAQACYEADAPVEVGSLPPNQWGLFEMHGNVDEWCADAWHESHDGASADGSARAGGGAANRVFRGGSWYVDARYVRAASRYGHVPSDRFDGIGFRCARVQSASESGGAEQAVAPADPASRASPEGARPQGSTSDTALLRVGVPQVARLPRTSHIIIRSDREELHLRRLIKPDWASAIGRDSYGLFTEITIPDTEIIQRMRWIPPGRFMMGSPDDEPGRFRQEGPLHEVTLEEGFWLFDTPCTQALWEVVMGKNPSGFQTPDRPVEQVSFNDIQAFLSELNGRAPELQLGLPSEAQWEYACRAGTETATYVGPISILGERNAPALDPIAWYGGNSGVEFELDNGYDSSDWKEKQYDHARAGTHPVGLKAANPWGLYDMLGNVREWCADAWHDSYEGAPADGSARAGGGAAYRVIRGGSWFVNARLVRAACRLGLDPTDRSVYFGFRCARVQSVSAASDAERSTERSKQGERSEPAATTGPKRRRGSTRVTSGT